MPTLIEAPAVIEAAGNKPKRIEEYAGRIRTAHDGVSVARMVAPSGWVEPGQRPEFEEITVVLRGTLQVEHESGVMEVGRSGDRDAPRRMGPLQHAGPRGGRICRRLPPRLLPRHRPPRRLGSEALPAHVRYVPEAFHHDLERLGVVVDQDEVAPQFMGRHTGRAAPGEEVEHEVAGIR